MIQRIQSLWLLLASAFNASTFGLPFYSGDWMKDTTPTVIDLNAQTSTWYSILTVLAGAIALATIFLFKNRKLQLQLCYLGILVTVVLLSMYFLETGNFYSGNIALWAILYFAILICYILAARGVWKDQKLIRSMDRLR